MPDRLEWQVENVAGQPTLTIEFALPAGTFATSVLREVVTVQDKRVN
jgi:tRNA(Glu) U13 pseudouridine synthase TruD